MGVVVGSVFIGVIVGSVFIEDSVEDEEAVDDEGPLEEWWLVLDVSCFICSAWLGQKEIRFIFRETSFNISLRSLTLIKLGELGLSFELLRVEATWSEEGVFAESLSGGVCFRIDLTEGGVVEVKAVATVIGVVTLAGVRTGPATEDEEGTAEEEGGLSVPVNRFVD
jgi:hypothetical protein